MNSTRSASVKSTPVAAPKASKAAKTAKAPKAEKSPAAPTRPAKANGKRKTTAASAIPEAQRQHYVEVAAYYIAARRDFAPGDVLADWLAAEAEVDGLIAAGRLGQGEH